MLDGLINGQMKKIEAFTVGQALFSFSYSVVATPQDVPGQVQLQQELHKCSLDLNVSYSHFTLPHVSLPFLP